MSGKLSYRRTKSGCICRQHLTADSPSVAVPTSHFWSCRKDFNSSRFAEATSTSKIAGFIAFPSADKLRGKAMNPPLVLMKLPFEDWDYLKSSIPDRRGNLPPLPGTRNVAGP